MLLGLTIAAVALAAAVAFGFFVVAAGRYERNLLLSWFASQQQEWAGERRELLNRIKPETAQYAPMVQTVPDLRHVGLEDDEHYEKIMQASKEQLAEMVEAGEL